MSNHKKPQLSRTPEQLASRLATQKSLLQEAQLDFVNTFDSGMRILRADTNTAVLLPNSKLPSIPTLVDKKAATNRIIAAGRILYFSLISAPLAIISSAEERAGALDALDAQLKTAKNKYNAALAQFNSTKKTLKNDKAPDTGDDGSNFSPSLRAALESSGRVNDLQFREGRDYNVNNSAVPSAPLSKKKIAVAASVVALPLVLTAIFS